MKNIDDNVNINLKLIDFLKRNNRNQESTEPVCSGESKIDNPHLLLQLLDSSEFIRTTANEVPSDDGNWRYNDGTMYNFIYVLLNDNRLLVIETNNSVDHFPGDPYYVSFYLYSNANQFFIQSKKGHRENKPYLNIFDGDGKLISKYFFEIPWNDINISNVVSLNELLPEISIQQLIKRYNDSFGEEPRTLSLKI